MRRTFSSLTGPYYVAMSFIIKFTFLLAVPPTVRKLCSSTYRLEPLLNFIGILLANVPTKLLNFYWSGSSYDFLSS